MFTGSLAMETIPKIGFAHHFYAEQYNFHYGQEHDHSFELVYVKAGTICAELYGSSLLVKPGSIMVLPRHLPLHLTSADGSPQAHCSVQLTGNYEFSFLETPCIPENFPGLVLPFVLPPCPLAEQLRRGLYAIVADIGASRDENGTACAMAALGLLAELNRWHRQNLAKFHPSTHALTYRIRQYIATHIQEPIPLSALAEALDRTPNYLNTLFRRETGTTLCQYINREKTGLIAQLMKNKGVSFETACANAGISDISYGYRLFKKHMGQTPGEYLRVGYIHR